MGLNSLFLGIFFYAGFQLPMGKVYNGSGVDVHVAVADLEVEVGSGRFSGVASEANDIAGVNLVANLDGAFGQVAIKGLQTVFVLYQDVVAVAALIVFRDDHFAGVGGNHGLSFFYLDVYAAVESVVADSVGGAETGLVCNGDEHGRKVEILADGFGLGGLLFAFLPGFPALFGGVHEFDFNALLFVEEGLGESLGIV